MSKLVLLMVFFVSPMGIADDKITTPPQQHQTDPEIESAYERFVGRLGRLMEDFNVQENMSLSAVEQKIASNGLDKTMLNQSLNAFFSSVAEKSLEIDSISNQVDSSFSKWRSNDNSWRDRFRTYPFQLSDQFRLKFSEDGAFSKLAIYGLRLDVDFSSGYSIYALDNFGISLHSGSLGLTLEMDSLQFMKRVFANDNVLKACASEVARDLSDSIKSLPSSEILKAQNIQSIYSTVCDLSREVRNAREFNSLLVRSKEKFEKLNKDLDHFLNEAAAEMGYSFAQSLSIPDWITNHGLRSFIGFFSEHSFNIHICDEKWKNTNAYRILIGFCDPAISVNLNGQAIFGETDITLDITENEGSLKWNGEVVPYVANFFKGRSKADVYKFTYSVLKAIESTPQQDMAKMGEGAAKSIEEFIGDLVKIAEPEAKMTLTKTVP